MRCQIGIKTRYFATFLSISLDKEIDYFEYQGQLYYFNKVNNFTNYYPYYVNALGLNGFRAVSYTHLQLIIWYLNVLVDV